MTLSFAMLCYLITVRPLRKNPILQGLEVFNELMLLVGAYHMIMYSNINMDPILKFTYGWSLDMLIFFKLIINMYFLCKMTYKDVRYQIKKYCLERKHKFHSSKIQLISQPLTVEENQVSATNINQSNLSQYSLMVKPNDISLVNEQDDNLNMNWNLNDKSQLFLKKSFINAKSKQKQMQQFKKQPLSIDEMTFNVILPEDEVSPKIEDKEQDMRLESVSDIQEYSKKKSYELTANNQAL